MENYLGATFVIEKEHPYSDCPPLLPQRKLEVLTPQEVKCKDLHQMSTYLSVLPVSAIEWLMQNTSMQTPLIKSQKEAQSHTLQAMHGAHNG